MDKEKAFFALCLSFLLLTSATLTIGCMTEEETDTTIDPTLPAFLPGILDKHIINPPPGEEWSSCPFLFEFDTRNATGFREVEADRPGAPTLALRPDATAIIPIIVIPEASIEIRISRTDGLPEGVQVSYLPESLTLDAGEKKHFEMRITSSKDLTVPLKTSVVVWMEDTGGWEVGKAFHLRESHDV